MHQIYCRTFACDHVEKKTKERKLLISLKCCRYEKEEKKFKKKIKVKLTSLTLLINVRGF